ncbi:MAG: hypothetical protein KAH30_03955 [Caldisericia bacterium]|nr:hypothetical protein [Caldisericia bacterium]
MKKFNLWDALIIVLIVFISTMFYMNFRVRAGLPSESLIRIEGKAGNLEKEIAHSVEVGDIIMDKNGTPFFRIESVLVRPSRQAIPNWDNEVISVDSPELETIEFSAVSVNPKMKANNLYYNWQLMNPGMKLYIETERTGFFAIILKIEQIEKTNPIKNTVEEN